MMISEEEDAITIIADGWNHFMKTTLLGPCVILILTDDTYFFMCVCLSVHVSACSSLRLCTPVCVWSLFGLLCCFSLACRRRSNNCVLRAPLCTKSSWQQRKRLCSWDVPRNPLQKDKPLLWTRFRDRWGRSVRRQGKCVVVQHRQPNGSRKIRMCSIVECI